MSGRQCREMGDALALLRQGGISVDQAARQAGVSRSQLFNVWRKEKLALVRSPDYNQHIETQLGD